MRSFALLALLAPLLTLAVPSPQTPPTEGEFASYPITDKLARAIYDANTILSEPAPDALEAHATAARKAKRAADALAAAVSKANAVANPINKRNDEDKAYAQSVGNGYSKVKRAAEAIAEALAEPEPVPEAHWNRWCHKPGQSCNNKRRAADELLEAAHSAVEGL